MALTDKLTAVANAIRSKTGKTDGLTLDAMPGEIEGIQTGGDTSIEDGLVSRTLTSYSNERVTTVGDNGLCGFIGLTDVSIPNATKIGTTAFANCPELVNISLPNAISLGSGAFLNCSKLREFCFPKVKTINGTTFDSCKNLVEITDKNFPELETIAGDYTFRNCSGLVYFQSSTWSKRTSGRHFQPCVNLVKVDVSALTSVSPNTFNGCSKLETLILRKTDSITTLASTNAISSTLIASGTGYVYVPSALIEEYKVATNWSTYADQFRAIEDYPEICEVGV